LFLNGICPASCDQSVVNIHLSVHDSVIKYSSATCFGLLENFCYGLDGPGIESQWVRHSPHTSRPGVFPGGKAAGGGISYPLPSRGYRKSRAIPLHFLWAFMACSRVILPLDHLQAWRYIIKKKTEVKCIKMCVFHLYCLNYVLACLKTVQ
jgi:hypothetical protein